MGGAEWAVVFAGVAAIVWINWYFFAAKRTSTTAQTVAGTQEVAIVVRGGYEPGVIRVKRGVPVRLLFDRQENASCSEEVVLGAFNVRKFLPAFQRTPVEFTPDKAGEFDVTCGMSMLHAKLVVED